MTGAGGLIGGRMSPGAGLALVFTGGPIAAIVSGALVGAGAVTAGLVVGAVTLRVVRSGLLGVGRTWVRDRTPAADETAFIGWSLAAFAAVYAAAGLLMRAVSRSAETPGLMDISFVCLFLGFTAAILARGLLRAARLLRRVPRLLEPGEEARAVAVRANGFARARSLAMLVATDDRFVWVERDGERSFGRADVEGVESDAVSGRLRIRLAGETLELSPVPRRELKTIRRLLSPARRRVG